MRNLKKLLAVVLTVVMLASMMVPALAANTYEEEALKLQSIGMFAGDPADLKLEEGVTRIQGLAFAIRAAGKEADAFAMTDEEVTTILADWTDAATIPAWGLKYAAYAIKNGITVGTSATQKIFGALDPISGTSFLVFLMISGMGYPVGDVTTVNVVEASVTAGILTAGQAATFGAKAALIRDDAAGILFGAAMNGVNADGTKLIDALIASGFVDADDALAAGFVEEVVPEDLEVVSVKALNLKQFVVVFNKVVDEDSATDIDNYALDTEGDADLTGATIDFGSDSSSVTVNLLPANIANFEEEVTLTVSGVLDEDENEMEEQEIEFEFNDVIFPTVVDAQVVGNDTIKVIFSEPVREDEDEVGEDHFEVDDGDYIIKGIEFLNNGTEVNVELYSDLEEGTIELKIDNTLEDYAGYNVQKKTMTLEVVEDNDPPVIVGYKDADNDQITLIFDNDIEIADDDATLFYHTNSSNIAGNEDDEDIADFIEEEDYDLDGNELTLYFTAYPLPDGVAKIFIEEEAINDLWDNENDKLTYTVEISSDDTAPTVRKIEVEDEDQIVITFSETLDEDSFDEDSFTLIDSDGDTVDLIRDASLDTTGKKIIVDFREDLDGDYSIVIEEVEDTAGNEIAKTTEDFTVDDETAPVVADFKVTLYKAGAKGQMIKIDFDDKMATSGKYSVLDPEKYVIMNNGTRIDLADTDADVNIVSVDDGEGVEIRIDSEVEDADDGININTGNILTADMGTADTSDDYDYYGNIWIEIGRVADAAGNYTAWNAEYFDIRVPSEVTYEVEATATDTIVITFDGLLKTFDKTEFKLFIDDDAGEGGADTEIQYAKMKTSINSDGDYVATITLAEDDKIEYDAKTEDGDSLYIVTTDTNNDIESKNAYGEPIAYTSVDVDDAIAPALAEVEDEDGDDVDDVQAPVTTGTSIVLKFEEYIDQASVSVSTFQVGGGDYEVTAVTFSSTIDVGGKDGALVITLTIENDDADDLVGVNIDQISAIRDLAGNKTTGIKTEVAEMP